jgi:hypothetical protein
MQGKFTRIRTHEDPPLDIGVRRSLDVMLEQRQRSAKRWSRERFLEFRATVRDGEKQAICGKRKGKRAI